MFERYFLPLLLVPFFAIWYVFRGVAFTFKAIASLFREREREDGD